MGPVNYTCGCYVDDVPILVEVPLWVFAFVLLGVMLPIIVTMNLYDKIYGWFVVESGKNSKFEEQMRKLSREIAKEIIHETYTQQHTVEALCEKKIKEIASNYEQDGNIKQNIDVLKRRVEERKTEIKELEEVIHKYSS